MSQETYRVVRFFQDRDTPRRVGDYLPARLLALCGELGLAIMLSLYPTGSCP